MHPLMLQSIIIKPVRLTSLEIFLPLPLNFLIMLMGLNSLSPKLPKRPETLRQRKSFIGLEATGHYHQNLTLRLRSLSYDVAVINPFDSWKEKLNKSSKTDKIDLVSIAKSPLSPENFLLLP